MVRFKVNVTSVGRIQIPEVLHERKIEDRHYVGVEKIEGVE